MGTMVEFTLGKSVFKTYHYDGYIFAADVFCDGVNADNLQQHLMAFKNITIRKDDVFVLTYPKSGTHLLRELVHMLQTGKIQYLGSDILDAPVCYRNVTELDGMCSPRVFHSHVPIRMLPSQLLGGRGKIIALFRNPKDVVTSYYYFFLRYWQTECTFQEFLDTFLEGKLFAKSWLDWRTEMVTFRKSSDLPFLVLKYEDCIEDLKTVVKKTAAFIGKEYDDAFYDEVVAACNIDKMRKAKQDLTPEDITSKVPEGYSIFYRKGICNDWKNTFTVSQDEQISEWLKQNMKDENTEFPTYK